MQVVLNKKSTKQNTLYSVGLYLSMSDLKVLKNTIQYMWCVFLLKISRHIWKRMEYLFFQNSYQGTSRQYCCPWIVPNLCWPSCACVLNGSALFSKGGSPSGDWIPQDWSLAQDKISGCVSLTPNPQKWTVKLLFKNSI